MRLTGSKDVWIDFFEGCSIQHTPHAVMTSASQGDDASVASSAFPFEVSVCVCVCVCVCVLCVYMFICVKVYVYTHVETHS